MANKTATLKNQAGDNIYPNIVGDNRNAAIKNSTTIKHTLTENKISLDLDEAVKGKIDAALQKPTGLTKTKLVGVGANGQENIEIGDNLTLANGKLSASGGGSGGGFEYDSVTPNDEFTSYTGTITGDKPVYITTTKGFMTAVQGTFGVNNMIAVTETDVFVRYLIYTNGSISGLSVYIQKKIYSHFITLTNSTSTFYSTFQNTSENQINTLDSLKTALAGKYLLCTGHTDTETAEYISGEGVNIVVGVVNKSDNSTSGITIDSTFTISDLVSPVE